VPGNHEYETAGAAGYFAYFGRLARPKGRSHYSFDLGGWHLIALDSSIDHGAGSAQERWLRADLVAAAKRCILAYWHFPRFTSGAHQGNWGSVGTLWNDLYDARADVVLSGHEHGYERFARQTPWAKASRRGIRQFIVGAGGATLMGLADPSRTVRFASATPTACWSWSFTRPATSGGSSPRAAPSSTREVRSLATEAVMPTAGG
jgi:Calcineurin-like phosphoesterase